MNKIVGIILKVVLLALCIVLGYYIVAGIKKPIDFESERERRFEMTKQRLIDIRTAQVAYRAWYGEFTPSFDSLINFINHGHLRVIYSEGEVPEDKTESQALKDGDITRDTILVPVKDSLFKHIKYDVKDIVYIPCGNKAKFTMDTATVLTGSGVNVKVFEARCSYWNILDGLDEQLIVNYNAAKLQRAHVDIYLNGNILKDNLSLTNGKGPLNYKFEAKKGDILSINYTSGSWSHENLVNLVGPDKKYILKEHNPSSLKPWESKPLEQDGEYIIQLLDTYGDGWYGSMAVGSLTEANNNAGNWE
ncbi:MAG TPA: hypothetical protein PLG05_06175 [Bacteroidales bacterium]|nr:hypothetical protein [Bacteroidales bacterium]HOR60924.1 hypothetical protein [Bacteroidales bacterium]HPL04744.1 hypothetical protein [Bacteroidales bacterium]